MDKKTIKIKFSGMGALMDQKKNYFTDILEKYYNLEFSENPDYLLYSIFSQDFFEYDCIRIYIGIENYTPDFNICDYAIGYDHLQFGDRYIRHPLYLRYKKNLEQALIKHQNLQNILDEKTEFCSFVYSNSKKVETPREIMFSKLSDYKKVNSGGSVLNNVGGPVEDKLLFEGKHKFSIAFENSSHSGYITEKIIQAFAAKTIPIYFGDPRVSEYFNPSAFINCHDFNTLDEVVDKVIDIDNNNDLYLSIMKQPIFVDNSYINNNMALEHFLTQIFDQPLSSAFRRNRGIISTYMIGRVGLACVKSLTYREIISINLNLMIMTIYRMLPLSLKNILPKNIRIRMMRSTEIKK